MTIEDCTFGHIWLTGINLTVSINNLSALGSVSYAISVRSSDNNHNISISGTLTLDSNMTAVFNGYRTGYLAAIASLTVSGDTYSSIDESKWTANLSDENVTLTKNDDGDYVYTKQTSD